MPDNTDITKAIAADQLRHTCRTLALPIDNFEITPYNPSRYYGFDKKEFTSGRWAIAITVKVGRRHETLNAECPLLRQALAQILGMLKGKHDVLITNGG